MVRLSTQSHIANSANSNLAARPVRVSAVVQFGMSATTVTHALATETAKLDRNIFLRALSALQRAAEPPLAKVRRALNWFLSNVTETFFWGFVGLDVIGIWIPRISVSLKRGREKYDTRQDPKATSLPLGEQVVRSAWRNVHGLNWPNFKEETWREFLSGPGILVIPTLAFALARHRMLANEMPAKALKSYTEGFLDTEKHKHWLQQHQPLSADALKGINKEAFNKALRTRLSDYLYSRITDHQKIEAAIKAFNDTVNAQDKKLPTLKKWMNDFVDLVTLEPTDKVEKAAKFAKRKNLLAQFETIVGGKYNKGYNLAATLELHGADHSTQFVDLLGTRQIRIAGEPVGIDAFLLHAEKWLSLPVTAAKNHLTGSSHSMYESIEHLMTRTLQDKGLFAFGAVLLTTLYCAVLTNFTQNHPEYPGERLNRKHQNHTHPVFADLLLYQPPINPMSPQFVRNANGANSGRMA